MATEEQALYDLYQPIDFSLFTSLGQQLTIPNRTVSKLGFWLMKEGTGLSGDVYFEINRVSDNGLIVSKYWGVLGDAAADVPTYAEVTFDAPVLINEEVRIYVRVTGGTSDNHIGVWVQSSDVKASEVYCRYRVSTTWETLVGWDCAYIYTYIMSPTVTTQVVKDVVGTTATGQGNVTDLGGLSVTQHGHCWNTSTNPTTSNDKTTNGAASAVGAFTSDMTDLTPGTGYYVRAYATNSVGTSYGANVYFVASLDRAGYIWMEGDNLRGFDENAIERKYVHTDDVDDTPVDAATTDPISSNWAYDFSTFGNRTHITGMVISDNFDASLAVSAGTGWCKVTDNLNAEGKFFSFDGANVSSGSLTDLAINYIYLDYNAGGAGEPGLVADITGGHFYEYDHIILGCAFMNGNHAHIINSYYAGLDSAHQIKMRAYESFGAQRSSGLVTTDPGTPASNRNIAVTAGVIWVGLTRQTTLSFDTSSVLSRTTDGQSSYRLIDSGASFTSNDLDKTVRNTTADPDTYTDVVEVIDSHTLRLKDNIMTSEQNYSLYDAFDTWYTTNSGSTWEQTEHVTQIDNFYWNDITLGRDELDAASHWGVYWLYIDYEGHHLHMVYGQASGIKAVAETAPQPSILPPIANSFGILIAKIIVQRSQTAMELTYPWITVFTSEAANIHDNLDGVAASTAHTTHNTADTGVHGAGGDTLATDADISTATAALDYGLSFEGIVTTATDDQHFKVATLAGKGAGFFVPNVGDPYEIYVVQADGAPPEGLHTPVLGYDTADGTFTHGDFITDDLGVGDVVLIMHPWLAFIKDIKADTEDLQGNIDAMHDTDLPAVKTDTGNIKTDTTAIIADTQDLQGNVDAMHDTDLPAVKSDTEAIIAAIPTVGEIQTEMEQDGQSLLDTIKDELANGADGLTALKTAIDAISGAVSTDWKGDFSWDADVYTTAEQDISALFSPTLALDVRRKYSVKLDLTEVEADASFDQLYLAVKEKIKTGTYVAIDRKTVTKVQIAATAEPGIVIDIPATSENIQITMKMKTQLAGDVTIYYSVVREHLE